MKDFGPIEIQRRTGNELFHDNECPLGFDLLSFWQWSASDIISNATRGVIAEYLVAHVLGVDRNSVREEWAAYDLLTSEGIKIEVKSAAYIQSWHQDQPSKITFRVPKTRAWDRDSNQQSNEMQRQADVYVFALLANKDQATIDPLDVSQWEFYVVHTALLDNRTRSQHSITLPSLRGLANESVAYSGLKYAILEAAIRQKNWITNQPA